MIIMVSMPVTMPHAQPKTLPTMLHFISYFFLPTTAFLGIKYLESTRIANETKKSGAGY